MSASTARSASTSFEAARARPAHRELPQRAADSVVHQCRVRAGDDRRCLHAPGRLRSALSRSRRTLPRQPAVVALPVPAPYAHPEHIGDRDREIASRCGRRVRRLAAQRERMDGHRARRRRPGKDRGEARLPPVPPVSQFRRGRDPALRPRRSRREAFVMCSSAARRFTIARRSRPFARRSRRSNGRTTSCPCLRRCAERCLRSAMRSCSSGSWRAASGFGVLHPFRIPPIRALAPCTDRGGAAVLQPPAPPPQLRPARRDDPGTPERVPRARRLRAAGGGGAGARERAARVRAGAAVRSRRRHLVSWIRGRAARSRQRPRRHPKPRSSRRAATASGS